MQALSRAWKERKEAEGFVREVQTQTKELTSQMYEAEATQVDDVDMATLVEELQEAKMRLQEAKRQVCADPVVDGEEGRCQDYQLVDVASDLADCGCDISSWPSRFHGHAWPCSVTG